MKSDKVREMMDNLFLKVMSEKNKTCGLTLTLLVLNYPVSLTSFIPDRGLGECVNKRAIFMGAVWHWRGG